MKIIAVYNIKGGVGKTSTSVNMAYTIAKDGFKTLIVDLDPQGASTYYFKAQPTLKGKSKKILSAKKEISHSIVTTDYTNLDILPADPSYRKIDFIIDELKGGDKWLKKLLKPVKKAYDYIILDCPPNVTNLSENVFRNSDTVLVPVVPTILSVRTYDQMLDFFNEAKIDENKIIPFFSMVEKRKSMHSRIMNEFLEKHPRTINVGIPYLSLIEKMGEYRSPVTHKYPYYEASFCYKKLWKELKTKID